MNQRAKEHTVSRKIDCNILWDNKYHGSMKLDGGLLRRLMMGHYFYVRSNTFL